MRVTFTKVDDKRYSIAIDREHGPALVPRFGPGYDDLMPHDLAHYLVEESYEIELGVWGQLAAGGGGIFFPAPSDNTLKNQKRAQRIGVIGREDMMRSEQLVSMTVAVWEHSIGRVTRRAPSREVKVEPAQLRAAVLRLGDVADRWHALQHGGAITFTWPPHLTFEPAKSRRGRRPARRTPSLARY